MAQLLHLDGFPQTWDELHARLAEYYAIRAERERVCGSCKKSSHGTCTGWMVRVDGSHDSFDIVRCPCECWEMKR